RLREFTTVRRRRDGSHVLVALSIEPVQDGAGTAVGAVRVMTDVSGRERTARAARHLGAIVESSDDAIVSKDLDGIVQSWNAAAQRMFGYTADEIVGRSIRLLIPADRQDEEEEVLSRIRRGDKVDHFETIRQRKDGSQFPISLTVSPIRSEDGTIVG